MEPSVKAAMIRSQHTLKLTTNPTTGEASKSKSNRASILRRTKSIDSFDAPPGTPPRGDESFEFLSPPKPFADSPKSTAKHSKSQSQTTGRVFGAALAMASSTSIHNLFSDTNKNSTGTKSVPDSYGAGAGHSRGVSLDTPRSRAKSQTRSDFVAGKGSKDKHGTREGTPSHFVNIFMGTSSLQLEVEVVKKLRLLLRNESARFVETYSRIDFRLMES